MRPSYSALTATKALSLQRKIKRHQPNNTTAQKYLNQTPSWSTTVTAPHITSFAEGFLKEQWLQRDSYCIVQVNKTKFLLCNSDNTKCNSYIPRFLRVRTVSIVDGRVRCTCRSFEQCRIACRHIMAISKQITLDFVGVRYFKLFRYVSLHNDGKNTICLQKS